MSCVHDGMSDFSAAGPRRDGWFFAPEGFPEVFNSWSRDWFSDINIYTVINIYIYIYITQYNIYTHIYIYSTTASIAVSPLSFALSGPLYLVHGRLAFKGWVFVWAWGRLEKKTCGPMGHVGVLAHQIHASPYFGEGHRKDLCFTPSQGLLRPNA